MLSDSPVHLMSEGMPSTLQVPTEGCTNMQDIEISTAYEMSDGGVAHDTLDSRNDQADQEQHSPPPTSVRQCHNEYKVQGERAASCANIPDLEISTSCVGEGDRAGEKSRLGLKTHRMCARVNCRCNTSTHDEYP